MTTRRERRVSAGKVLISLPRWAGVGPCMFDWCDTQIHDPTLPTHAQFHNAQPLHP